MDREYRAKIFKSGNSLALRLPKALGLSAGTEMRVREDARGGFVAEPTAGADKIDLTGIWGSVPGIKPLSAADREIDERELDWDGKRLARD